MGRNLLTKLSVGAVIVACTTIGASAQALLQEGFEYAFPPQNWTVVNSTAPGAVNHWGRVTYSVIAGTGSAHVTSPSYEQAEPVKEEVLITPAVTLDGYYDLNFIWKGATAQSINKAQPEYDFQVRIREAGSSSWTKIFSFLEEDLVRGSGLAFPWASWTNNPATINLTDWANKKVEIAFVYCLLKAGPSSGNDIWIDEVSLTPSQKITGPVASVTPESYVFPTSFLGVKTYSEYFTLKNTGKDVLTVTNVEGLNGTDFGCSLVPSEVSLKTGDTYQFRFSYSPTMNGAARATAKIVTNGGNVEIALSGTKKPVPDGGVYEGFESEVFPPLGWTRSNNNWYRYGVGLSGDASAICVFPDAKSELVSPRLDLSANGGNGKLEFTYFESFDPMYDDSSGPANYFRVYYSKDGKKTWSVIFDSNEAENADGLLYELNTINHVSLDLTGGSNDSYIKFVSEIPGFSMSDYDEIPDYSMVYVDDVVLPALYGSSAAPASSSPVNPTDGAKDVYNKNLTLEWTGALFATNYKLYLGKSATNFDVLNGVDMGTVTSYTVPRLDYDTKYYWKVVAYNGSVANTSAPTWSFTVMADQSVKTLPYEQKFDESKTNFPLGWHPENESYTRWQLSDYSPYGGQGYTPFVGGSTVGTQATLESPEITLPTSGDVLVSFVWGNAAPSGLKVDATGTKVNNTKEPNDQSVIYFEVEADGKWNTLGLLSEKGEDLYWYRESYQLNSYAGKTVTFRWRYVVNGYAAGSASVDNFLVEVASADKAMVQFNSDGWDAGYVNNGWKTTSRNPILLSNIGATPLKVRSASFTAPNFSTDLKAGTEIAPNRSTSFAVTYEAGEKAGEVTDAMLVTFENGTSVSFPVKGTTLEKDIYYYNFEGDEHASTEPNDFTTIDKDGYATVQPIMIYYPKRGAPYAYIVLNITGEYADWRNVYPVSGEQVLAAMSESTGNYGTDDWIISPQMTATDKSNFRFYAKSYGDSDQRFSQSYVEVLVSTQGKDTNRFETVMSSQKIPWSGSEGKWTEFNVDLSKYAGQNVHIAVRNTMDKDGFVAFYDDFWFEHFNNLVTGVDSIVAAPEEGEAQYFDLNGLRVNPENAAPGIYVKKVGSASQKVVVK